MIWLRALSFFLLAPAMVLGVVPYLIVGGEQRRDVVFDVATYASLTLIVAGVAGLLWCFALFVHRGRGTPAPYDPPRALVAAGPYTVSRNPMYVCLWLTLSGEVLVARSGPLTAYAAVVVVSTVLFVRLYEEPSLRLRFGADYDAYRARVPRWLGRPRGSAPVDGSRPAS